MNRSILMLILTTAFVAGCGPVNSSGERTSEAEKPSGLPTGKVDINALKNELLGLTPKEVKDRLGPPDQTLRNPDINGADGFTWTFWSIPDAAGNKSWFDVHFNGNVVSDVSLAGS